MIHHWLLVLGVAIAVGTVMAWLWRRDALRRSDRGGPDTELARAHAARNNARAREQSTLERLAELKVQHDELVDEHERLLKRLNSDAQIVDAPFTSARSRYMSTLHSSGAPP